MHTKPDPEGTVMPCRVPVVTQLVQSTLLPTASHGHGLGGNAAGGGSFLHPRSLLGGQRGEGRGQLSRQRLQWATEVSGAVGDVSVSTQKHVLLIRAGGEMNWGGRGGAAQLGGGPDGPCQNWRGEDRWHWEEALGRQRWVGGLSG